jgi:hypothetical protein
MSSILCWSILLFRHIFNSCRYVWYVSNESISKEKNQFLWTYECLTGVRHYSKGCQSKEKLEFILTPIYLSDTCRTRVIRVSARLILIIKVFVLHIIIIWYNLHLACLLSILWGSKVGTVAHDSLNWTAF